MTKPYLNLKHLRLAPSELAELAQHALRENNTELIQQVDQALHFHFLNQARQPKAKIPKEFLDALLVLADSREVRKAAPEGAPRAAARWEQLFELADVFSVPADQEGEAREFVESRQYGWELLRIVAEYESRQEPLAVSALAAALGRSDSTVVQVLGKMEARGVVERRRAGQNVFVGLGLMGQMLIEVKRPVPLARTMPPSDYISKGLASPGRFMARPA